jgi:hypothetical protein
MKFRFYYEDPAPAQTYQNAFFVFHETEAVCPAFCLCPLILASFEEPEREKEREREREREGGRERGGGEVNIFFSREKFTVSWSVFCRITASTMCRNARQAPHRIRCPNHPSIGLSFSSPLFLSSSSFSRSLFLSQSAFCFFFFLLLVSSSGFFPLYLLSSIFKLSVVVPVCVACFLYRCCVVRAHNFWHVPNR